MGKEEKRDYQETIISLADLFQIVKRAKSKIITFAILFSILGAFYTLRRPISYEIVGSFREKELSRTGVASSYLSLFQGKEQANTQQAVSSLTSRKLMERIVKKLHLQATIAEKGDASTLFKRVNNNFKIQYAHYKKKSRPIFPDKKPLLICTTLSYDQEFPSSYTIKVLSDEDYVIYGEKEKEITRGKIGEKVKGDLFEVSITRNSDQSIRGKEFSLSFVPLQKIAESLSKSIGVEPDLDDKSLLIISYNHPDRQFGTLLVNLLMEEYKEFQKDETSRATSSQIRYLTKRQREAKEDLEKEMERHAKIASKDLSLSGFIDSEKQMAFLATAQIEGKKKLQSIDVELKRLKNLKGEKECVLYDRFSPTADSEVINRILNTIRSLKQQGDSLEIALEKENLTLEERSHNSLSKQFHELSEVDQSLKEIEYLLIDLKGEKPPEQLKIIVLNQPNFLVKQWHEKLEKTEIEEKDLKLERGKLKEQKKQFESYLKNLYRIFNVRKKMLEEQLTHNQNPREELQGIDLATAKNLFLHYTKEWDQIKAQLEKNSFILEQIEEPEFDLSSLSASLSDPLSQTVIKQATESSLLLYDEPNRSDKEKERLKSRIKLSKRSLTSHLTELNKLIALQENIVKEKIVSLQYTTLDLIHQQISLLEKELTEFIDTRLDNLKNERELITAHLEELQKEMATLPEKWSSEQIMKEQLQANRKVVQEITHLVESKNLTYHLELVQSEPIDLAYPPTLPNSPRLMRYIVMGGCFGAFLATFLAFFNSFYEGLIVSEQALKLFEKHVSGNISAKADPDISGEISDSDLETLRHAMTHLCKEKKVKECQTLSLIQGKGPNYSKQIGKLLAKQGKRTLVLPAFFDNRCNENETTSGLIQVLTDPERKLQIKEENGYYTVSPGGFTRYGIELISSKAFSDLLQSLKKEFDWIIIASKANASSAEGESILKAAENGIITLTSESVEEIKPILQSTHKVSFIFYSS